MTRKFHLLNDKEQRMATILYFYENQLLRYVGIIITPDLARHETWLYKEQAIELVLEDLAKRLNIQYSNYLEVQ